jgi:hypothetical protein
LQNGVLGVISQQCGGCAPFSETNRGLRDSAVWGR